MVLNQAEAFLKLKAVFSAVLQFMRIASVNSATSFNWLCTLFLMGQANTQGAGAFDLGFMRKNQLIKMVI